MEILFFISRITKELAKGIRDYKFISISDYIKLVSSDIILLQ